MMHKDPDKVRQQDPLHGIPLKTIVAKLEENMVGKNLENEATLSALQMIQALTPA